MIRIKKNIDPPSSLAKHGSFSADDVIQQLKADQFGKCYICERSLITDFQVDHHKSQHHFPELTYHWTNLFWICSYCNSKKSSFFDNILSPIEHNIEDLIYQHFDFPNSKVLFTDNGLSTENLDSTISLLNKIFNGSNLRRNLREQLFYNYAKSKITSFQDIIISWLNNESEESQNAIIDQLNIKSEFLGSNIGSLNQIKNCLIPLGSISTGIKSKDTFLNSSRYKSI